MAVVFDSFVRLLRNKYPKVTYVSNITDIDDKIIEAANESNIPINELTKKYTDIYNADMSNLNVLHPDIQPKATEYVEDMVNFIDKLIQKDKVMKKMDMYFFMFPHMKDMENYQTEKLINSLLEAGYKFRYQKSTGLCFVETIKQSQPGWILHGELEDRDGIQNVV